MEINLTEKQGIRSIKSIKSIKVPEYMKIRLSTGLSFMDEVLGSSLEPEDQGFIAGSFILFSADPGAGKSTICRQMVSMTELSALYNVGEEGLEQTKMAVEKLGLSENFDVGNIKNVDMLMSEIKEGEYQLVILDSLQNLVSETDHSGNNITKYRAGSQVQVTTCTERLYAFCKANLVTIIGICHSTKGGGFAGPQSLEHTVDVSLNITVDESDEQVYRSIMAEKNRFGMSHKPIPLKMSAHGMSRGDELPPQQVKGGNGERLRNGKPPIKKYAREIWTEMSKGGSKPEKEAFIAALVEKSGCEKHSAISYYYMIGREQ